MCKENGIQFKSQYVILFKNRNTISSRNNAFDVNRFFRTYVFTFPATETNRFVYYLE
jgi:hypothetical protein